MIHLRLEDELEKYLKATEEEKRKMIDENRDLWYFLNSVEYIVRELEHETISDKIEILEELLKEVEKKIWCV